MKWARIATILPVGKLFDRIFTECLAPCAKEAGADISRLEPEFSRAGQLGHLCQSIEQAQLIVADVTARNSNVLYLAGYAHGIGREVLFLTQQGEDFPLDRAKHRPIIYGHDHEFLKTEFRHFLGAVNSAPGSTASPLPREQFLATFGDLLKKHQHEHHGDIYLEDPTTFVLIEQDMDLPLVQDLSRRARELGLRIKLM